MPAAADDAAAAADAGHNDFLFPPADSTTMAGNKTEKIGRREKISSHQRVQCLAAGRYSATNTFSKSDVGLCLRLAYGGVR